MKNPLQIKIFCRKLNGVVKNLLKNVQLSMSNWKFVRLGKDSTPKIENKSTVVYATIDDLIQKPLVCKWSSPKNINFHDKIELHDQILQPYRFVPHNEPNELIRSYTYPTVPFLSNNHLKYSLYNDPPKPISSSASYLLKSYKTNCCQIKLQDHLLYSIPKNNVIASVTFKQIRNFTTDMVDKDVVKLPIKKEDIPSNASAKLDVAEQKTLSGEKDKWTNLKSYLFNNSASLLVTKDEESKRSICHVKKKNK